MRRMSACTRQKRGQAVEALVPARLHADPHMASRKAGEAKLITMVSLVFPTSAASRTVRIERRPAFGFVAARVDQMVPRTGCSETSMRKTSSDGSMTSR
jgi:hypothetical protein